MDKTYYGKTGKTFFELLIAKQKRMQFLKCWFLFMSFLLGYLMILFFWLKYTI